METKTIDVAIKEPDGTIIFQKLGFEVPATWSERAATIVASKYAMDSETSVLSIVDRIVNQIADWGSAQGYFESQHEEDVFSKDLKEILLEQRAAFNSPVWFNVGADTGTNQAAACFILPVEDTMDSILNHTIVEGNIFKGGSGAGINISKLRSRGEKLSNRGSACFTGDTRILTMRGLQRIDSLCIGEDKVILPEGIFPITSLHKNGIKDVVKVTFEDGRTIKTTREHQLFIMTETGKIKKVQLKDIVTNPDIGIPIFSSVENIESVRKPWVIEGKSSRSRTQKEFKFKIETDEAWLLGHHAGDGHTLRNKRHSSLGFSCNINEKDTQNKIKRILEKFNLKYSSKDRSKLGRTDISIFNSSLVDVLDQNKLLKENSSNIHIPEQILTSSVDIRASYLAGWLDADGCILDKRITGKTICKNFAYDLQELLASIGVRVSVTSYQSKQKNHKEVFRIEVIGKKWKNIFLTRARQYSTKLSKFNSIPEKTRIGSWNFNALKCLVSDEKVRAKLSKTVMPYNAKTTGLGTASILYQKLIEENQNDDAKKVKTLLSYSTCKITNVEEIGSEKVYDITIEKACRYITNGLLVSNSGPVSFMRGWDAFAGVIKSGGKVRRAAKLVCMDTDHPDIMEFIECKYKEEQKAKILIDGGVPATEAYTTVDFQNANHSIRVTDKFMAATLPGHEEWALTNRGNKALTYMSAEKILRRTAEIAWETGDPGIQFDNRMNVDNPVPSLGKIRSTNPCSEFSAIDNSSCNLASLNLVKYLDDADDFNGQLFKNDIEILITAMDILVDSADYPTPDIRETTIATRPLGLGFSNLGAYLIRVGLPYDSQDARDEASFITRLMTTQAYESSVELAKQLGSFKAFEDNKEICIDIATRLIQTPDEDHNNDLEEKIRTHGLRNSQLTLLAPCGTISFVMDCDTTGIEPLFARKSIKTLAGGGSMEIVPQCVNDKLTALGKAPNDFDSETKAIFKTANEIHWQDHIKMMAACQRHLNGAISKTINMPGNCSIDDIEKAYVFAWKQNLKSLAIYRDGSKNLQPLTVVTEKEPKIELDDNPEWSPVRRKLPATRQSLTHKFNISGTQGFIQPSIYEDGSLGEIFLRVQKQGSTINGLMDAFAVVTSLAIQYGVPLDAMAKKLTQTRFDPQGITTNEDIRMCSSLMDYIFRWLVSEFGDEETDDAVEMSTAVTLESLVPQVVDTNGPPCTSCGGLTQRTGACFVCLGCGSSSGCG